jgi:uncharacterized membrane protein YqjE
MAASGTSVSAAAPQAQTDTESLPVLFGRLGDDVMQFFDTKLSLLEVEMKEEANAYVRGGMVIGAGGIVAAVGFALVNVAVAFGVSTLFSGFALSQTAKYALGFVITGIFYLIMGSIVVKVMNNRLAKVKLLPERTVEELRKDKQWLKKEL